MRGKNFNKYKTVRVSVREWDYVRYLLDPRSETFTNCYQSALKAGFSAHVSRMITWRIDQVRVGEILHMMQDPANQQLIKDLRDKPAPVPYVSAHLKKDIAAAQNREWKQLERELTELSGVP